MRKRRRVTTKAPPRQRKATRRAKRPQGAEPADLLAVETVGGESSSASGPTIVGIGASAGGLEAFSQLLRALPPKPGMGFVVVQHLAPHHESVLPTLLSGQTPLPVVQATEGMRVEPDRVYVIPPNTQMGVHGDMLHLGPRPKDRSQYNPIDFFLRTLAESAQERAIAVILSGTASDGAEGIREIKAMGGFTIAQRPETARYDGMPRAAIASGFVDLVLSPQEIGEELVRLRRHHVQDGSSAQADAASREPPVAEAHLERIFSLLRAATGVDFRRYKLPTIQRRIHRRLVLHKLARIDMYVRFLQEHPSEVQALYHDILIHVTRFFREPDSFEALGTEVLPRILERRQTETPIRIWVSGCSTGEEVYSVAIVLLEYLGEHEAGTPVQIFATDISEAAIEHARNGTYPESIAADVSPARLRRFFTKTDAGYRVTKVVRDLCVFARQDLTRDPPFSKLDLILCRNVLIYLGTDLQKRLMNVFHYALKPTGFLMIGHAETIGANSDLFSVVDKKHRIYRRKAVMSPAFGFPFDYAVVTPPYARRVPLGGAGDGAKTVQSEAGRILHERFAPPAVIVDTDLQIVQFRGETGPFLEPAPGDPSLSLLKMAREGLLHGLRTALAEARQGDGTISAEGLRVRSHDGWRRVDIEVVPLTSVERPHYLVLFKGATDGAPPRPPKEKRSPSESRRRGTEASVDRLNQELASSRDYLQSTIQELEAANEELQSANEEILSSNEELQSTNEELDTAKEELQSSNEELNTVNEELNGRNDELSRANSDLVNLLSSVQIAIVIVASDLRIRRFTPMAERVLNLIPSDVGRPIGHIKPNIDCPDLEEQITEVVDTVTPSEREVRDRQGHWLSLRIRPYKNVDNRIDGAVLTLFEIDSAKRQAEELRKARDYALALIQTVSSPLALLDESLTVKSANAAFLARFGLTATETTDRPILELAQGRWDVARLRAVIETAQATGTAQEEVELEEESTRLGRRPVMLIARRVEAGEDRERRLVLCVEHITARPSPARR